jgi:hypothetical protein
MSANPKQPFLLFGRFAIPLFVWLIIGPIAAIISWLLLKNRDNLKHPKQSVRPNFLQHS